MALAYCVDFWGSHPDEGNDDCWTGVDFETEAEARALFDAAEKSRWTDASTAFFVLDGPGVHEVRENPLFNTPQAKRDRSIDDALWVNEGRMQNAMAFGVDGWNDF